MSIRRSLNEGGETTSRTRPPRIVFISDMRTAGWGGSEELWARTAKRMVESGCEVTVNVIRREQVVPQLRDLEHSGCRMRWVPRQTVVRRVSRRLRIPGSDDWSWISGIEPDLVVSTLSSSAAEQESSLACERQGIPYVLIVQNAAEYHWPNDAELELAVPGFLRARRSYFVSGANRMLTEKQLGITLPNAELIRNPFNCRYDADPHWPTDDGRLRLACVARLDPASKGQDLILELLAQEKWRQRSIALSLYGSGRNDRSLRKLANDYYGLESVEFRGHTVDIERVWMDHHALIMPSRYEGLPLAVVEAMLCRRCCIVTDVAGHSEVIEDGRTGFLAAAPTVRHLDEALERAWARRDEFRAIGAEAGRAIRNLVPADPIEVFANKLRDLLTEGQAHASGVRSDRDCYEPATAANRNACARHG